MLAPGPAGARDECRFPTSPPPLINHTEFFVENAINKYGSEGPAATLAYYNREKSVDGQWYVFIVDEDDKIIGHYDAHLIGHDLKGPVGTDAEGYNFGPDMLAATEEGQWVSFVFANPESELTEPDHTGAVKFKHAWVVRHDGLLFGSGWYHDGSQ